MTAALLSNAFEVSTLAHPLRLLWLLPAVVVVFVVALRAGAPALAWPACPEAREAGARRFDIVRATTLALRAGVLVALGVAVAGPIGVHRVPPEPGHGLDLVLAIDASGSMRAVDTEVAGERRTRLDLAREVVGRFARERAAEGDRVALVVFGESAFTACPLTGDGRLLAAALDRVGAGIAGEATALGDALALAVKRALAGERSAAPGGPLAGRVVVLLTDGRDNAGSISVEVATALAASEGVRVHTVAIGTAGAPVPVAKPARGGLRLERHDVDRSVLDAIATATGGRFFPARRSDHLDAVYREIDALERIVRTRPPRVRHTDHPEPLLALAGGLLLLEIGIGRVLRRPLP